MIKLVISKIRDLPLLFCILVLPFTVTLAGSKEDAADSSGSLFTFSFYDNGKWYCDPLFIDDQRPSRSLETYAFNKRNDPYELGFTTVEFDSVANIVLLSPGDTLYIYWTNGWGRALIKEFGLLDLGLGGDWTFQIEPLDTLPVPQFNSDFYLALTKRLDVRKSIIPFKEYSLDLPGLAVYRDSITSIMVNSRIEYLKSAGRENVERENWESSGENTKSRFPFPFYSYDITACGKVSDSLPDTLFIASSAYVFEFRNWFGLFLLIKNKEGWSLETIESPESGYHQFKILFSLDLDSNGVYEYFVDLSYIACIYIWENNEFNKIKCSINRTYD